MYQEGVRATTVVLESKQAGCMYSMHAEQDNPFNGQASVQL